MIPRPARARAIPGLTRGRFYITIWLYNEYVMNTTTPDRLDATFAALADPTRRAILARLASGEQSVMALAAPFEMTQPAISRHLKVLEQAGLITRGRDAQRRPCRIEAEPLAEATRWLVRYRRLWARRFTALDRLLEELQQAGAPEPSGPPPTAPRVPKPSRRSR